MSINKVNILLKATRDLLQEQNKNRRPINLLKETILIDGKEQTGGYLLREIVQFLDELEQAEQSKPFNKRKTP